MDTLFWFGLAFCLTSQSAIFSLFGTEPPLPEYLRNTNTLGTLKCLAQGHYTAVVGFEPWTSRSVIRSSSTVPPRPLGRIFAMLMYASSFIHGCSMSNLGYHINGSSKLMS